MTITHLPVIPAKAGISLKAIILINCLKTNKRNKIVCLCIKKGRTTHLEPFLKNLLFRATNEIPAFAGMTEEMVIVKKMDNLSTN